MIELIVPSGRPAPRGAGKEAEVPPLRGPARWREWQRLLDEGVYRTRMALARGEGVSPAAVTQGLRKLGTGR